MEGLGGLLMVIGIGFLVYAIDDIIEMLDDHRPPIFLAGLLACCCSALLVIFVIGDLFGRLDDHERRVLGALLFFGGIGCLACFGVNHLIETDHHRPPGRGGPGEGTGYHHRSSDDGGWGGDGGDGGDGGGGDGGG